MNAPPAFGAYRLTQQQQLARGLASRLPATAIGRLTASLLFTAAGGRRRLPADVEIFGNQKARLHPYDNLSEKRVFITPQFWEAPEREVLAGMLSKQADRPFTFFDVGANAGLYTLFCLSECQRIGRDFCGVAIEPDPHMLERMAFNLAASNALDAVRVLPWAIGSHSGTARFKSNGQNRGEGRLSDDGTVNVEVRTLAQAMDAHGSLGVDAMKIDIEGGEFAALAPFFASAGRRFWPRLILIETSHPSKEGDVAPLLLHHGYQETLSTVRNAAFVLGSFAP